MVQGQKVLDVSNIRSSRECIPLDFKSIFDIKAKREDSNYFLKIWNGSVGVYVGLEFEKEVKRVPYCIIGSNCLIDFQDDDNIKYFFKAIRKQILLEKIPLRDQQEIFESRRRTVNIVTRTNILKNNVYGVENRLSEYHKLLLENGFVAPSKAFVADMLGMSRETLSRKKKISRNIEDKIYNSE